MGTSVPQRPRWAPDSSPAEQTLWRWCVGQLPDRVLVLPQVAMTVGASGRVEEAEADLVLLDPEHGLIVVEVKGGTLAYDANRAVWRRSEGGSREVRNPVNQAKRARSVLRHALESRGVSTATLAMRWVVATPDCRLDAPGEPILREGQLWDALASDQLLVRYGSTCGPLSQGEQPLGESGAEQVASVLRGRSQVGRPVAAAAIDEHEAQVRIHTESHRNVLRRFATHPFVLVRGAAGTGKTILALEAAVQFASLGERVLLTCWNVMLGRWMRDALREELRVIGSPAADAVTADPRGQVVVTDIADVARHGVPGEIGEDLGRWYHERLPEALTPEVTGGEFDVIVMDEAQDLSELWVLAVASLVARGGRWYAFADGQQDLFAAGAALPDFLDVQQELLENFRNSRSIAAFAARFGGVELDCVTGDGPPVRFVAVPGEHIVARTTEVARRLQRDERIRDADLAVLWLFHNPKKGASADLADDALSGARVETNSASFKGMERPVVVLGLDMDPEKPKRIEEIRRAIYVAATRARSLLVVVGDPEVAARLGLADLAGDLRSD
jgi:hypothetical protein